MYLTTRWVQHLKTRGFSNCATIPFKAETQKILSIVSHSLYKDKKVFIREQISNASDALEKLRYLRASSQLKDALESERDLEIRLTADAKNKTFTIEDSGVGMSREELIENIGTIARSGTQAFLEETCVDGATDLIGKFGVGFYSSFIVANRVDVYSRSCDKSKDAKGWHWSSDGSGTYTIEEKNDLPRGTKIVCHLKDDCVEFANFSTVKKIAEEQSSFVRFPLIMREGEEDKTLNTHEPLWLKPEASEEEHLNFFRHLNNSSWGSPMYRLAYNTDAPLSIKALFYIPEEPPSRLFQTRNDAKVALHCKRVLVKASADEVIPKWLFFITGIIDCEDLPLNVSRENMQNNRLTSKLSATIVRRLLRFFEDEAKSDPEKFEKFYKAYSYHLKEGLLDDLQKGSQFKDQLLKLIKFETSESEPDTKLTLKQYIETLKPNQKNILYFCASDRATALESPYMEKHIRQKRSVLLLYEDIDEFVAMNLQEFEGKKLVAADAPEEEGEADVEEEPEQLNRDISLSDDQKTELEAFVKATLGGKLSAVKFSDRLVNSPAVVTGFLSSTLRKMMKATLKGSGDGSAAMASMPVTLELNPSNPIVTSLVHLKNSDASTAKLVLEQLYDNACIAAGILDDPRIMLSRLNLILEKTAQLAYHQNMSSEKVEEEEGFVENV